MCRDIQMCGFVSSFQIADWGRADNGPVGQMGQQIWVGHVVQYPLTHD